MSYCVNCGAEYLGNVSICDKCNFDPGVAEKYIDQVLEEIKLNPIDDKYHLNFAYPREHFHLVVAIVIAVVIGAFITGITLGVFLLGLLLGVAYLRVHQVHTRTKLIAVTPDNFSQIYDLSKLAAFRLRIPLPPMYIKQDPHPNAFTMGFWGDSWIVIHSSLVELLSSAELLSVIGHEMGHIKSRHTTWLTLTNPVRGQGIPIISSILGIIFNVWSLKAEYTADRTGLIAVRDFRPAAMTEIKLALGKRLSEDFDLEGYLEKILQKKDELFPKITETVLQTHPYVGNRIRELKRYSESEEFREIIGK